MKKTFEVVAGLLILFFMAIVFWQISSQSKQSMTRIDSNPLEEDEGGPRIPDEYGYEIIPPKEDNGVACTMDAKICPDGSAVGRTAPNCEFAPCPNLPSGAVDSFEDCVAAGNPVMESYPRQCNHGGKNFVEDINQPIACTMDAKICPDGSAVGRTGPNCEFAKCPASNEENEVVICSPESKLVEACTMDYTPVCGLVEIQCVTTPCDPIPQTFGNACGACAQGNVISYTRGECEV